jgi:predicted nucleotidyltransferase
MDTVSREQIAALVDAVARACDPERILLFGSHARGQTHAASDVDLFVIKRTPLPRRARARQIRRALWGRFPFPKDIVVYTPDEVDAWRDVRHSFVHDVLREGVVAYEKQQQA